MKGNQSKLEDIIDDLRNNNFDNMKIFLLIQSKEENASPLDFDLYEFNKQEGSVERVVKL